MTSNQSHSLNPPLQSDFVPWQCGWSSGRVLSEASAALRAHPWIPLAGLNYPVADRGLGIGQVAIQCLIWRETIIFGNTAAAQWQKMEQRPARLRWALTAPWAGRLMVASCPCSAWASSGAEPGWWPRCIPVIHLPSLSWWLWTSSGKRDQSTSISTAKSLSVIGSGNHLAGIQKPMPESPSLHRL